MLLSATVVSLSVLFALLLVSIPVVICFVCHKGNKKDLFSYKYKTETHKTNRENYYRVKLENHQPTYEETPIYSLSPEYTYERETPPRTETLYEPPEAYFDTSLVNEIENRMYSKCLYGKGEYLRKSKVKFTGSEEEWREKNLKRGLEFEKKMEDEVVGSLKDHHLIKYKFQERIAGRNLLDIVVKWEGNKKCNVIIIECKHSSNQTNKSLDAEEEQIRAGLEQLNRYQTNYLKVRRNPQRYSILLVLLIDFPIPFWEANYPFIFKDNVLFINYICFSHFLESLDEVSVFI